MQSLFWSTIAKLVDHLARQIDFAKPSFVSIRTVGPNVDFTFLSISTATKLDKHTDKLFSRNLPINDSIRRPFCGERGSAYFSARGVVSIDRLRNCELMKSFSAAFRDNRIHRSGKVASLFFRGKSRMMRRCLSPRETYRLAFTLLLRVASALRWRRIRLSRL